MLEPGTVPPSPAQMQAALSSTDPSSVAAATSLDAFAQQQAKLNNMQMQQLALKQLQAQAARLGQAGAINQQTFQNIMALVKNGNPDPQTMAQIKQIIMMSAQQVRMQGAATQNPSAAAAAAMALAQAGAGLSSINGPHAGTGNTAGDQAVLAAMQMQRQRQQQAGQAGQVGQSITGSSPIAPAPKALFKIWKGDISWEAPQAVGGQGEQPYTDKRNWA